MDSGVIVQVNQRQMRSVDRMLANIPKGVPRVVSRALNATAKDVQKESVDEIKKQTKFNKSAIKSVVKIKKASMRKQLAKVIYVPGKRIPLVNFSAKQTGTGVTFKNWGKKGRGTREHAFVTKMPQGHKGVFIRKIKDGERVDRLPIQELFGPSISQVFESSVPIVKKVMKTANTKLTMNINKEVVKLLAKTAKSGAA